MSRLFPSSAPVPESDEHAILAEFPQIFHPGAHVQERIKLKMQIGIAMPRAFRLAREAATPTAPRQAWLWSKIRDAIDPAAVRSFFDRIRAFLTPSVSLEQVLRLRMLMRLQPAYVPVVHRSLSWAAAFVLLLFAVRVSPLLFLAPHSVARSPMMLLPTRGEVSVLIGGLWQPLTHEMIFTKSVLVRTQSGEATLVLHDDAVIRLAPETTVALHDTADRPELAKHDYTFTLHTGQIWLQSLVPAPLQGITVATAEGTVTVHEGSLSIADVSSRGVDVRVWDRSAQLMHEGRQDVLVSGERVELKSGVAAVVKNIAPNHYDEQWVTQNLKRDAVHRREIAQMQHERRAAQAGILPTSRLYTVKRVAEAVDVMLTFGEEAKTQKRLDLASTRLHEAAALLAEGSEEAAAPLAEYREILLAIATGSGEGSLARFLLKQELAEAASDIAAASPADDAYAIKRIVLETSAAVPGSFVAVKDVQGVLLVDTLSSLMRSVEEGNIVYAKATFDDLKPYLDTLDQEISTLSPSMQREAKASLATFALALESFEVDVGGIDRDFLAEVSEYLPRSTEAAVRSLTDAEINLLVQAMYGRIFLYKQPRSRWNQLLVEFRTLDGLPDQGRILRWLYRELPENGLARYVKTEFERVKEARAAEQKAL